MRSLRACPVLLAAAVLASPALAQLGRQDAPAVGGLSIRTTTFNNGLGFGARAMGMAGAFTAIADDASAASWNPAGLGQLIRPEVTVVGGWNQARIETTGESSTVYNTTTGQPRLVLRSQDRTVDAKSYGVDFASYVQPWKLGRQLFTTQISYARNARPLNATESLRIDYSDAAGHDLAPDFYDSAVRSRGGYDSFGIGLGTGFDDRLYIGFTLNWYLGTTSTTTETHFQSYEYNATGQQRLFADYVTQYYDEQKYSGLSASVGILAKPSSKISIGLVYRGGWAGGDTFTSRFDQRGNYTFNVTSNGTTTRQYLPFSAAGEFTSNGTLSWPWTLGGGVAVRPVEAFTIALDASQTQWSRASISRVPNVAFGQCVLNSGAVTCPVAFSETAVYFPSGSNLEQNNQRAFRAGLEYVLRPGTLVVPIRVGAYRIKTIAPIYDAGDQDPETNFDGFTGGLGLAIPMGAGSLLFDFAAVFDKASSNRNASYVDDTGALALSQTGDRTVKNRRFIGSVIVRF